MKELQHSLETEKLAELIAEKKRYYNKLYRQDSENQYLTILNSEIAFLQNTVMPILLMRTTYLYGELSNFLTKAMRELEGSELAGRVNGVLLYIQTKEPKKHQPFIPVAFASNVKYFGGFGIECSLGDTPVITYPIYPEKTEEEKVELWRQYHLNIDELRERYEELLTKDYTVLPKSPSIKHLI